MNQSNTLHKSEIGLDRIRPNPYQPRQHFDPTKLVELAQSIERNGLIQPIVIEARNSHYIIHDGERRWRSSCLLAIAQAEKQPDLAEIAGRLAELSAEKIIQTYQAELEPARIDVVVTAPDATSDQDLLIRAVVANDQRDDLSPIERARSYQRLKDDHGLSDRQIADQVGRSRTAVANIRRLLELPADVQTAAVAGEISERQAQALLPLYQLPEPAMKQFGRNSWCNPKAILKAAKGGMSSTRLRDDVTRAVSTVTIDTTAWGWFDHTFEGQAADVRSPRCADCPILVKRGKTNRCPDQDCARIKTTTWAALHLAEATAASGLSPLEDEEIGHRVVEHFYSEGDALKEIVQAGCPHGNLRLRFDSSEYYEDRRVLDDFPDILVVCRKGEGSHCRCLAARRREAKQNDQAAQEEKARKRTLEKEIVAPAAQLISEAFRRGDVGVFRLLLQPVANVYSDDTSEWDMDKVLKRLTRAMVQRNLPYNAVVDLDRARTRIRDYLAKAGLGLPGDGPDIRPPDLMEADGSETEL